MLRFACASVCVLAIASPSLGQATDVCAKLIDEHAVKGFYISEYGQLSKIRPGKNYEYSLGSSIHVVLSNRLIASSSTSERAFVIKLKTFAYEAEAASAVIVNRPTISTSCRDGKLQTGVNFLDDFVDTARYIDHHAEPSRPDSGLSDYFHFDVNDQTMAKHSKGRCFHTDDKKVVRNRASIFLFDQVVRPMARADRLFNFDAVADGEADGPGYRSPNGLTSELVYLPPNTSQCLNVALPKPSYPPSRGIYSMLPRASFSFFNLITDNIWSGLEAQKWKPYRTEIEVRSLSGSTLARQNISWRAVEPRR